MSIGNEIAPCPFGSHRVVEQSGTLPQAAWKLDNTPAAQCNEILCDVDVLNIDSASFHQITSANEGDVERIASAILGIVLERGKHHNPVTGSGGMFLGRVRDVGQTLQSRCTVKAGDRIASLVSLTLTPLRINRIDRLDLATGRVWIEGTAILFESGIYAKLPGDIPDDVALSVLDVAGAPAQVRRLTSPGDTVAVFGADGKSGILACVQSKAIVGQSGRVIGIGPDDSTAGARLLIENRFVDTFIRADARDALAVFRLAEDASPGGADLTVNCVNVPGTELASILVTRDGGTVYFFSMSTSFTAAALGAEGVGKDVTMIIGNGYATGHAEIALQTLRDNLAVKEYFLKRFGQPAR